MQGETSAWQIRLLPSLIDYRRREGPGVGGRLELATQVTATVAIGIHLEG